MNWHNLSEKLPTINKSVFICNEDITVIYYCKLCIHDGERDLRDEEDIQKIEMQAGDIFWSDESGWCSANEFPYWLTNDELVELIKEKEETANRFELLDIGEKE